MIISFEGPDSSGKSTQAELLKNTLIKLGLKVKLFHFPRYESPIGDLIGKAIQDKAVNINFTALQMLYAADQTDFSFQVDKLINDGYIIILDRFDLSTTAYYIAKKKCTIEDGVTTIENFQKFIKTPDVTFIFDYKHSISNRREENTLDKIENDTSITSIINDVYVQLYEYLKQYSVYCSHKKVRDCYLIDASNSIDGISKDILNIIIEGGYIDDKNRLYV